MALYEVPPGEREGINIHSRFPGGMRSCLRSRNVSRGWLDLRPAGRVSIFFTDFRSVPRIQIANGSRIQVRLDRPTHAKKREGDEHSGSNSRDWKNDMGKVITNLRSAREATGK